MHRFYLANADFRDSLIKITDSDEIHHLAHVIRLKKGDCVSIFNGMGEEIEGNIIDLNNKCVDVQIISYKKTDPAQKPTLILACAIPKKAKFETIIEKCTELGVDEVVPLITQRTEMHFDEEKARRKLLRYRLVAINAAKQCQRLTLPVIRPVSKFNDFIRQIDTHHHVFIPCLTGHREGLLSVLQQKKEYKNMTFIIGPEGDFTPDEVKAAVDAGCVPVSLGPTVLKVDTAAISVVALVNFIFRG